MAIFAGASSAQAHPRPPPKAERPRADVVTATKTGHRCSRPPVSPPQPRPEKAHVQTIVDFVHLVPSFQATTQGDHGVITMTLRGVGNDSAKTEYADPEVAVFVDGIYSPRAEGAAVLLFDMDSIEVLRGPQGTLWGRNSTVGAINMQTAKPVLKQNFTTIEGGMGDYNGSACAARSTPPSGNRGAWPSCTSRRRLRRLPGRASHRLPEAAFVAAAATSPTSSRSTRISLPRAAKYNAQDQSAARLSLLWRITPMSRGTSRTRSSPIAARPT